MPRSLHLIKAALLSIREIASILAIASLLAFSTSEQLHAQSSTWTGAISSNWDDPSNWTNGVPDSSIDAIIAAAANSPSTAGAVNPSCLSLLIEAGATLGIAVGNNLVVNADSTLVGSINGGGALECAGQGTISTPGGNSYSDLIVSGSYTYDASGDPDNFMLVEGDLCITGTLDTAALKVKVQGQLKLSGSLNAANAIRVLTGNGFLLEDGVLNTPIATLIITGDFVSNGGRVMVGPWNHEFQNGLCVVGTSFVQPLPSKFVFVGAGEIKSDVDLPTVKIEGTYTLLDVLIGGDLEQTSTAGPLSFAGITTVQGNALFSGPTILETLQAPGSTLNILGNGSAQTTSPVLNPPLIINVNGNWTTNANWTPLNGTVNFQGSGPQLIRSPIVNTTSLIVGSSSLLTFQGLQRISVLGSLTISGLFQAPPDTSVSSNLVVPLASQLSLTATALVGGSVIVNGSIIGAGSVRMIGGGIVTGSGSIGNLGINTTGLVEILNTTGIVNGNFTITNGQVRVGQGNSLDVSGFCSFLGGTLGGDPGSLIRVVGDVNFLGTVAGNGDPDIICSGNYTADANYTPSSNTVTLNGQGAGSIAAAVDGGSMFFNNLIISEGSRRPATDIVLHLQTLDVLAGAALVISNPNPQLDTGGENVTMMGGTLNVDGNLSIEESELCLEIGSVVNVGTGATIRVVGSTNLPSTICGPPCGNYEVNIAGRIEALNFQFLDMGPTGIRILDTATFAAAPFDFRAGLFAEGAPGPGSVQLDIDTNIDIEFRDLTFVRSIVDMPEFNVRSASTNTITCKNFAGNFGGMAFEDDPNDVIEWPADMRTQLSSLNASSLIDMINLDFTTSMEVDLTDFRVTRSQGASGIFVEIPGSPIAAMGVGMAGASYSLLDTNVVYPNLYTYRIEETLLQGSTRLLGEVSAVPRSVVIGDSVFVGPGGFTNISAAASFAQPGTSIVVAAGTYPNFVLTKPVSIMSDGSGPVIIDTMGGKVEVRDIQPGQPDLTFYDIEIMSSTDGPTGIDIINCANPVILDNITVNGSPGVAAMSIDNSPQVALQNCNLSGTDALAVSNNSSVYVYGGGIGNLSVLSGSQVTHVDAGLNAGNSSADMTSSLTALPGTSPRMDFPNLWPTGGSALVELSTDPGDLWCLFQARNKLFFDLNVIVPSEMLMLLDPFEPITMLRCNTMGSAGTIAGNLGVPNDSALWGTTLSTQMLALRPPFVIRFGNVRDALFLPPGN